MTIDPIQRLAQWLIEADHAIAFTGAGISTPSGIPDFRSPTSGIWNQVDPFEVASIYGFRRNPQAFYNWVHPLTETTLKAQPNPAHVALSQLEQIGKLRAIVTQNIDMLHTRAGSQIVHELHGHMRETTCIRCFEVFDNQPIMQQFLNDKAVPTCRDCGGVLKPNIILFGEQLPIRVLHAAQRAAKTCDLMLVVGSSLEVAPANELPIIAQRNGAKLVIVNLEATDYDRRANLVLNGDAATLLPEVIQKMELIT